MARLASKKRLPSEPNRSRGAICCGCIGALGLAPVAISGCFDSQGIHETPSPSKCPARRHGDAEPYVASAAVSEKKARDGGTRDLSTSVQFAAIGDYGLDGTNEGRVAALVDSWDPDFVITTGDNNYFQGSAATIDRNIGQYYCQFIGNYLGDPNAGSLDNRFWPTPGNHDWLPLTLKPYTDYFTLPGNERYYDVERGLVHLYALDSDVNEPDGNTQSSAQADFLRDALARSTSCFDIVYFHHPPYSSGPHGSTPEMQWPFEAWGAEAVMAGHDHLYERFEVGQIPYFTVGLGGSSNYDFVTILPETRAQYHQDFGALRVSADRHGMTFEFVDANGVVVDSSRVDKECP